MPRISFIINSFNRLDLLNQSLASVGALLANERVNLSVVIFDAGSTDGSLEAVRRFRDKYKATEIHLIVPDSDEDTSFAAGLNRACAFQLRKRLVEYFFFFETDNFISGIDPILRAIHLLESDPTIGACGYTVKKRDGQPAGFGERFPTWLSFLVGQQVSQFLRLGVPHVTWLDGGAPVGRFAYCDVVYTSPLIIRATAWQEVGGMDSKTFPFSDCDLDLAFRLKATGYRSAVLDESAVYHDNLGTMSEWSATRTLRFHAARFELLKRHRRSFAVTLIPFLFMRHLIEWCVLWINPRSRRLGRTKPRSQLMRSVWSGYRRSRQKR